MEKKRRTAHVDDHHAIHAEPHPVHHLAMVLEIPHGVAHDHVPRAAELRELPRVARQPHPQRLCALADALKLGVGELERVAVERVAGEGEEIGGEAEEGDVVRCVPGEDELQVV